MLEDVDLTAADGEIVAVTGVNGAGKSPLLSCLAGRADAVPTDLSSGRGHGRCGSRGTLACRLAGDHGRLREA